MTNNLRLEIFRIALKKKAGSNKDLRNFEEFFNCLNTEKDKAYNDFIGRFIDYFNNEFKPNADGTKAISSNENNTYKLQTSKNIIDGEVLGGNIGNEHTIYSNKNSKNAIGKIQNDQVPSRPFFFKIWTPFDYTTGILIVQSYSTDTITQLVKANISKFFNNYDYSLLITPFVPEKIKNDFLKNSQVYKLSLVKDKLTKDKRKTLNPLFTEFEGLKIEITVTGFNESVEQFWKKFKKSNNKGYVGSNLEDFDIKEEEDYDIKAFYKNEEGHQAHVGVKKNKDILPTIFLPDAIKKENSNQYDFSKIKSFTDDILQNILEEIKYNK